MGESGSSESPATATVSANETALSAPTPERQAELEAAYQANLAAGAPPYAAAHFRDRAELEWVIARRGWDTRHDAYTVKYVLLPRGTVVERADLRGAVFGNLDLSGVQLRRADLSEANLVHTNLAGADLVDADFSRADLGFADLRNANLHSAHLAGTSVREANLSGATLHYADLRGARMYRADLTSASLVGVSFDASSVIAAARLDTRTRLCDVNWGGAPLSHVAWSAAPRLGDERTPIHSPHDHRADTPTRVSVLRDAARAYQQLAAALRAQGLDDAATPYAYRAQALRRKVYWREGSLGRWFFSWLLAALAGYGYKLQRILITYALALSAFALIYFAVGLPGDHATTPIQHLANAYLVSLTAIHGRTFFEQFGIGSGLSWVAAIESVCGLVIEAVFTSMLVQRFFAR